ncbi:Fic family protein [Alphaproteobacteria bacterium]|jgi:Fic family protein|nr:Fic family protein [Alphaproteobacteria bacterium]
MSDNDFGLDTGAEASLMAANGVLLSDFMDSVIKQFLEPDRPFRLTVSLIRDLQGVAVRGLRRDAGNFRSNEVSIHGRIHKPPQAFMVENLIRELCDSMNLNWHEQSAFHLAAYVMWCLNWIHPFSDGNGRTSRSLSYIILCTRIRHALPGEPTIPAQIEANRQPYFDALEDADTHSSDTTEPHIVAMETLIKDMLAYQLLSVVAVADGSDIPNLLSD